MYFKNLALFGVLFSFSAHVVGALEEIKRGPGTSHKGEIKNADLNIEKKYVRTGDLPPQAAAKAKQALAQLGAPSENGMIDKRGGRISTVTPAHPLIPGRGEGNDLEWDGPPPADGEEIGRRALKAFQVYMDKNSDLLEIDMNEFICNPKVTAYRDGGIIHIHLPRCVNGIRVDGCYLTATINNGNIVLFGFENYGDISISFEPTLTESEAMIKLDAQTGGRRLNGPKKNVAWGKAEVVIVPMALGSQRGDIPFGRGYTHRLVWELKPTYEGDIGLYKAFVDAHSGEVLLFEDTIDYLDVRGGVLPVSNDGIIPDGTEQASWPLPFAAVIVGSEVVFTNTGGNAVASGVATADLSGQYVKMVDLCGTIQLTDSDDGLDFGTSAGTDCATPGFGGAGNTHASRTGFYELNKIIEMGRGQLPSNSWLEKQLTSTMNIGQTCNAYWNGNVNFYRSGSGCSNTGEIAGVFDHEWGHGMDANDATPGIASPSGEGIADIYAALRLNDSCIGRNFRSSVCTGNGDPCLTCTGVRDIDYLKRQSGLPHSYTWSNSICGGSVHCVGGVYSEAVWSLWKRKLQQEPYNYDNNRAHEIVTRLTFIGAGNTGTWFSGGPPNGGCSANSGYMNYLAADDDNGNLNDGTPHMSAIYSAFHDQEIACETPVPQNSGCEGTPGIAPTVIASGGNELIHLNWGVVSGAVEYEIFRTEGVFRCDFGKVRLGNTAGTDWIDTGLQNGRDYSYVVIPKGNAAACFGPASECVTISPVVSPDFSIECSPSSLTINQGGSSTSSCTIFSINGFSGSVIFSCQGNPGSIQCTFSSGGVVALPSGGSTNFVLTVNIGLNQAIGQSSFFVEGTSGTLTRSSSMNVFVAPEGSNGPQTAVYDSTLGAPKCSICGSLCDSNSLLDGRANVGPEPNQPNTLGTCTDGASGTYHSDESNDRVIVRTLDGGNLEEGKTVEVEATVWAWGTGSSDTADFYYAADASNPTWELIASTVPTGGGQKVLVQQYTLPAGSLMQAVRVNFRYSGSALLCPSGTYDDTDDLVFAVCPSQPACTDDSDCDDGVFCNGVETCSAGSCVAGTDVDCDDGVACTDDTCNEEAASCENTPNNTFCNNGLFCDGVETCDLAIGCRAGTPMACDDGVGCTDDSCNEDTDSCENTPNNTVCDNGLFCDGAETCDPVNGDSGTGCFAGTPACDDGVACTDDTCNEDTDSCEHTPNNTVCDNGLFCDGAETCDPFNGDSGTGCFAGTPACDDGVACTDDTCNEETDSCEHTPNDTVCDNGLFCDGVETCDLAIGCIAGTPISCNDSVVCTDDSCNEDTNSCEHTPNNTVCDNGLFCDGVEICDPENVDDNIGCKNGNSISCDDGVDCTDDTCNDVSGMCVYTSNCLSGQICGTRGVCCVDKGGPCVSDSDCCNLRCGGKRGARACK